MHYCFVSREYPPNLMGGIGTYVVNMVRILAEAGHTVSVLTQAHPEVPQRGIDEAASDCDGRLRVYYLPFVDQEWRLLPEADSPRVRTLMERDLIAGFSAVVADALEALLLRESVDVIEAPEYEAPLLNFQQRRATQAPDHPWQRVPTVVHLHSPSHMIFRHNDDPLTGHWVRSRKSNEAQSILLADGVLCPSQFLADQVAQWLRLPEGRIKVLPYPIGPLLSADETLQPVPGRCLFVGRVEPRKGVFEFVEAAVSVAKRYPEATFRFVGGPHFRDGKAGGIETAELLRELIPVALRDRFDFAGRVPRETLGDEYRRAAFCAVPSRWDNYPNTCMEAMSCGRAVVASDQGGMAEMLQDGECGFVCPGGDGRAALVQSLIKGLERALSAGSERLEQMGAAARARILDICNDDTIARDHEAWYAELRENVPSQADSVTSGVILFDAAAPPMRALEAVRAVHGQSQEVQSRVIVGARLASTAEFAEIGRQWQVVPAANEEADDDLAPLPRRLNALVEGLEADVLYVGSTDDVLHGDALRQAANLFVNKPAAGFCSCWVARDSRIFPAYRMEAAEFLSPAAFPERFFFRAAAIRDSGGLLGNGSYLPDVLRDLVLRMLRNGWNGASIPSALVSTTPREQRPVIRPFAFNSERDSARDVAMEHQSWVREDSLEAAAEPWLRPVD